MVSRSTTADLPTGEEELDLGRAALDANDPDEAAVRLGLAIRVAPALAPAVLDLIAGRTERAIALVRGDAYRLVGRELEARRAFADAARGGVTPAPSFDPIEQNDRPPTTPTTTPTTPTASRPTDPTDSQSEGDPA